MSMRSHVLLPLALATSCLVAGRVWADQPLSHQSTTHQPMPHAADSEAQMHSDHPAGIEIPQGQPVPSVTIAVIPDRMKGWNVHVQTRNFAFSANPLSHDSQTTEGHAHLFLNGKKLTRLYGNWYYLEALPKGRNTLRVTLNTNQHQALLDQGKQIGAEVTVVVP